MGNNEGGSHSQLLIDAREFSVGRTGIGLPGESEIVRFNGLNRSRIEFRNDGSVFGKNIRETFLIPFSSPEYKQINNS